MACHRGGEEVLLDVGGQDATEAFEDVGHSDEAREILEGLLVGNLKRVVCYLLSLSMHSVMNDTKKTVEHMLIAAIAIGRRPKAKSPSIFNRLNIV